MKKFLFLLTSLILIVGTLWASDKEPVKPVMTQKQQLIKKQILSGKIDVATVKIDNTSKVVKFRKFKWAMNCSDTPGIQAIWTGAMVGSLAANFIEPVVSHPCDVYNDAGTVCLHTCTLIVWEQ